MSDSPPSAISDDTLLSLFEGRIPKTTVEYDRLLTKAVELLHQKMQRDVSCFIGTFFYHGVIIVVFCLCN